MVDYQKNLYDRRSWAGILGENPTGIPPGQIKEIGIEGYISSSGNINHLSLLLCEPKQNPLTDEEMIEYEQRIKA